jgi:hypothetical protein
LGKLVGKESNIDTVCLSLIITGNGLIPVEYILLEPIIGPLRAEIVTGIGSDSSGEGPCQGDLLWPAQLTVVNINHNMKIVKEILSDNHIVRAQLYNNHWKALDLVAINLNIKQEVLGDRGSPFPIKSFQIDRVRKLSRLCAKSVAEVWGKTRI